MMRRRPLLAALACTALPHARAAAANPPLGVSHRPLVFPGDHGAHPDTHVEWWYITGWLQRAGAPAPAAAEARGHPDFGFQVTFFRTRTGLAGSSASRFAAHQLVFAHVALTDLSTDGARDDKTPRLLHDQRIAREGFGLATVPAADGPQAVRLLDWSLTRAPAGPQDASAIDIAVRSDRFALQLTLRGTQPPMLQGEAGWSQKGPLPRQASHYYSEPQLVVQGRVERPAEGRAAESVEVAGRAWLDHEWSDEYLPPEAVGWDWIGFDLFDGSALMAFRLRRPDGTALWGGGGWRDPHGVQRNFGPGELRFEPVRSWTSPRTRVRYPVEWRIETPAGAFQVVALADDQELDSRGSTGALYWEGLSALRGADGRTLGWGYLELTGYAERLRM